MVKKPDSNDAVAAFLAKGGAIKKCPPAEANATPLRKLRAKAESNADMGLGYTVAPSSEAVRDAIDAIKRETQVVPDGDDGYVTIENVGDSAWRQE